MKKLRNLYTGLTFRLVFGTMIIVLCVNIVSCIIGYRSFTQTFTQEYGETACYTAVTASQILNGNRIQDYLNENRGTITGVTFDYRVHWNEMEDIRSAQDLNAVYVITVDGPDYDRITSIYNTVDPNVYPSTWEVGYSMPAEKECKDIYRHLYEDPSTDTPHYVVCPNGVNGSLPFVTAFVPITNDEGKTTALMCVQRSMNNLVNGHHMYLQDILISFLLFSLITGAVLVDFLRRHFVKPTQAIMEEAVRFSRENTLGSREVFQAYTSPLEIREIRQISQTLERMEMDTVNNMENLKRITSEQQRLRTELSLAWEIQNSVLPDQSMNHRDFSIVANMTPAKDVGGDFYDYFPLDEDHMGLVIADVSGKGIPAALFMMNSKLLLQTHTMMGGSPAQILERVNNELCKGNITEMFVTVWLGILTISTGEVIAANAAHEYPVIGRRSGSFELLTDRHGVVLGGLEGSRYHDYSFRLEPGDTLFLYTDGVTEATNGSGELFGTDRMLDTLNEGYGLPIHDLLDRLSRVIHDFVGEEEPSDDITMLGLTMACDEPLPSKAQSAHIDVVPLPESMPVVSSFLEDHAVEWGIPMGFISTMLLVLDEVYSNIIYYSQAHDVKVELEYDEDDVFTLRLRDDGIPYNPTNIPEPDLSLPPEERALGGLGMKLVRTLMSKVEYQYQDGRNVLTLVKEM